MRWSGSVWVVTLAIVLAGTALLDATAGFEGDAPEVHWVQPRPVEGGHFRLLSHADTMSAFIKQGEIPRRYVPKGFALAAPKGLPKWMWVGAVQAVVPVEGDPVWARGIPQSGGKAETLCLWTHPHDKGPVILEWSDVPVGTLHGLVHFLPAADAKAGVRLKVYWNGSLLQTHAPATQPGKSFFYKVNLVSHASRTGRLRLEVEVRVKGRNHICVDGLVEAEHAPEESQEGGEATRDHDLQEAPDAVAEDFSTEVSP